jgi:hypothetical protein
MSRGSRVDLREERPVAVKGEQVGGSMQCERDSLQCLLPCSDGCRRHVLNGFGRVIDRVVKVWL